VGIPHLAPLMPVAATAVRRKRPFACQAFGKHAMSAFWRKAVGDKLAS
jgi:hypothetical protein